MDDFNGVGSETGRSASIFVVTDGPPHAVSKMVEAGATSVALLVWARFLPWSDETRPHCDIIDDVQQRDSAHLLAAAVGVGRMRHRPQDL